jgi:predicted amidophosphoribosyltransferase
VEGRPFDHTRLILKHAYALSDYWPFDVEGAPAIAKARRTQPMAQRNWRERKQIAETELRDALVVANPSRTRGRRILVFDDVFTDGLTLREVARCLLGQGGAREVAGIYLARQPWKKGAGA